MNAVALSVLALSAVACFYAHAGYPLVLALLARRARAGAKPRELPLVRVGAPPMVSILVAAWNEEDVIAAKIENGLSQDYPKERLEVVVVSDGSLDRTDEIVRELVGPRVQFLALSRRGGKARAIRAAATLARGDILVLTDANALFARDAVSRLVDRLQEDASATCAFGNVRIREAGCSWGASEGLFWKLERKLQSDETAIDSAVGVDGALYAIRRERFVPPPEGAVLDDLEVAIEATRRGGRVVYEPRAVAWEDATPTLRQEFRRKTRTVAGAIQALRAGRMLPDGSRTKLWFAFASHKLLRWGQPVVLILLFVSAAVLAPSSGIGKLALGTQLVFYGLALLSLPIHERTDLGLLSVPLHVTAMHAATLVGLVRGFRGRQPGAWTRADRRVVVATTGIDPRSTGAQSDAA